MNDQKNFTPGPWVFQERHTWGYYPVTTQQRLADFDVEICLVAPCAGTATHDIQRANGQLIAAAPDLLSALICAVALLEKPDPKDFWSYCLILTTAKQAIAKAGGNND